MPILSQDIRLYKSDTLTDEPSGGGLITHDQVIGDQSNELMKDISPLDRTYGRMMMRKVFSHVTTQDVDTYLGAHTIVSKIPEDSNVGVTLFSTRDHYDRRDSAAARVENYRAKGALYTGTLWSVQWKGGKVLTIFQSLSAPLPAIGEVLYLTQKQTTEQQYVKISKLTSRIQEFTIEGKKFKKRILELEITQPLLYDFEGIEMTEDDAAPSPSEIRKTVVANAAKYYSSRPTTEDTVIGSSNLRVDSIFSRVVPSSVSEVALLDADINGEDVGLIPRDDGDVQKNGYFSFSPAQVYYLGMSVTAESIHIQVGNLVLTDRGENLYLGSTIVGSVNYTSGSFTMAGTSSPMSGSGHIRFTPAVKSPTIEDSDLILINDSNRGNVYTYTFPKTPKVGSVRVQFRSFGEWYELRDNSSGGLLAQEDGIGTGQVNYNTKSLSVSLAALPDEGSAVIITWGYAADVIQANVTNTTPRFKFILDKEGIDRSTVVISWSHGGVNKTATVNGSRELVGDATGSLIGTRLYVSPKNTVPKGTAFTVTYNYGSASTQEVANVVLDNDGNLVFSLDPDIVAGTLRLTWNVSPAERVTAMGLEKAASTKQLQPITTHDDSNGGFDSAAGSVNYANGDVVLDPVTIVNKVIAGTGIFGGFYRYIQWEAMDITCTVPIAGTTVTCSYLVQGSTGGTNTEVFNGTELELAMLDSGTYITGTAVFDYAGKTYTAKGFELHTDVDYTTGFGTVSGAVSPDGVITISNWSSNSGAYTTNARIAYTADGKNYSSKVAFRVPNAPVKAQSLQITYTLRDGNTKTVISGLQGQLDDATLTAESKVLYDSGVVVIEFVDMADVATLKYNAVVQQFLPLDENILKLNPVRLPQDGRVSVFAVGDVVVILHDNVQSLTPAQGDVTTLRPRTSKVDVLDSAKQPVPVSKYTVDLEAGTITWGDLTGVSLPVTVTDRIEDMRVLTDVQITGRLEVNLPLTHVFPANESMVCSAVVHSDVFANVTDPFDQQSWTGVWADARIGSDTLGVFNTAQYPIVVNNASCIEERWLIKFRSSTHVDVIGEHAGQVLTNVPIAAVIAPVNPNTNEPWFTVNPNAFGSGWSGGNAIRFNTKSATVPMWVLQAISPTAAPDTSPDALRFCIELRGSVNS
jgi:hypothetical protein